LVKFLRPERRNITFVSSCLAGNPDSQPHKIKVREFLIEKMNLRVRFFETDQITERVTRWQGV